MNILGRQRKWFKLDDAIAELSVHKPMQCKYVKLLSRKSDQTASNSTSDSGLAELNCNDTASNIEEQQALTGQPHGEKPSSSNQSI